MNDAGPGLDQRILDAIEEGGVGIEIGEGNGFQFETLAGKVRINELLDLATSETGGPVDGGKICEDLTWRLVGRFVDEGLLVWVQFSDVDGLKELS